MLNFLEATHHKVSCAMAELDRRPKPQSKYEQHIERSKDKNVSLQIVSLEFLSLPACRRYISLLKPERASIYKTSHSGKTTVPTLF